jgi:lipopolysaccharide exporter
VQLKQLAITSARWSAAQTAVVTAIQFVQLAVLARLLNPFDFGLMAMITVVIGFARLFEQMGLSEALIQRSTPTQDELSSLYWFNLITGLIVFCLICAAAPLISWGFNEDQLTKLVPAVATSLLLHPFGMLFYAWMRKELHFGILALTDVTSTLLGALVSVLSAWLLEMGVWSLVWGTLIHAATQSLLCLAYGRSQNIVIRWHFAVKDLQGYLKFGSYYVASMMANFFNARVDQLMIGALLGPTVLGHYRIASQLTTEVIQKINPVLTRVAFPVLVRVKHDRLKLKSGYLQLVKLLTLLNAPLYIGLAVVAPWAVPTLFGAQWEPAVPLTQILAGYALIRSIGNASGALLLAYGRTDWSFRWNVGMLAVTPPVVYAAASMGNAESVAWGLFGLQVIGLLLVYFFITRRIIGQCFRRFMASIGIPITVALAMATLLVPLNLAVEAWNGLSIVTLDVVVGGGIYLLLLWLFQRQLILELIGLLRNRP